MTPTNTGQHLNQHRTNMENVTKNVFGQKIATCSESPLTGYFRDGCCNSDIGDIGEHTVCAVMTKDFLKYSQARGNDLITPIPQFNFPGLKPGDHWCLCATRWLEAKEADCAPLIYLEATNESFLEHISLEELVPFAHKKKVL